MAEETLSNFPYRKLRYYTYLTLDVMMFLEYQEALNFMYTINNEGRSFIMNNIITIRNGFINDGLFTYQLKCDFNHCEQLERLYF